jgi:hypothetical protein
MRILKLQAMAVCHMWHIANARNTPWEVQCCVREYLYLHNVCPLFSLFLGPCVAKNNGTCCAGESGESCCNVDSFMSAKAAVTVIKGGLVGGPDQTDK